METIGRRDGCKTDRSPFGHTAAAVATPLERQFSTIAGLDSMTSSNVQGGTGIVLQFNLSRNIDAAAQDVQAMIAKAQAQLPPDTHLVPMGHVAAALNVTNPSERTAEPFNVTSPNAGGTSVPTILELSVTGVRFAARTEITVTVGTTAITGDGIVSVQPNPEMPGFDIINFTLPASLAGAGDVPVQVTFTRTTPVSVTTVSRPADTAPRITIN